MADLRGATSLGCASSSIGSGLRSFRPQGRGPADASQSRAYFTRAVFVAVARGAAPRALWSRAGAGGCL